MTEHINQVEQGSGLGEQLRKAREAKGLSEIDLADLLRLDKAIILKIEQNGYHDKQMSVFVKGYYRAYAKQVGVPVEYIDRYLMAKGLMAAPHQAVPAQFAYALETQRRGHMLKWTTALIMLFMFALVLAWIDWQRSAANVGYVVNSPMHSSANKTATNNNSQQITG